MNPTALINSAIARFRQCGNGSSEVARGKIITTMALKRGEDLPQAMARWTINAKKRGTDERQITKVYDAAAEKSGYPRPSLGVRALDAVQETLSTKAKEEQKLYQKSLPKKKAEALLKYGKSDQEIERVTYKNKSHWNVRLSDEERQRIKEKSWNGRAPYTASGNTLQEALYKYEVVTGKYVEPLTTYENNKPRKSY